MIIFDIVAGQRLFILVSKGQHFTHIPVCMVVAEIHVAGLQPTVPWSSERLSPTTRNRVRHLSIGIGPKVSSMNRSSTKVGTVPRVGGQDCGQMIKRRPP